MRAFHFSADGYHMFYFQLILCAQTGFLSFHTSGLYNIFQPFTSDSLLRGNTINLCAMWCMKYFFNVKAVPVLKVNIVTVYRGSEVAIILFYN